MTKIQTIKELSWEFNDYIFDLEKEWRNSLLRFSDKELLTIFPEVKQVIPQKITEWNEKRNELRDIVKKKLMLIRDKVSNEFSQWFWREWVKVNEGEKLLKIDGHIARLKRLLLVAKGKIPKGRLTEEEIQKALHTPIENVANQYIQLRQSGRNLVGLCPFHNEKHPSFFVYPETNSFCCYGCWKSGNVINLVKEVYNFSFKEAVKYLIGEK